MNRQDALRKKLLQKVKEKVREEFSSREVHALKAVSLLEDLDSCFNLLAEHCRDWHAVHFPELSQLIEDNEKFLEVVAEFPQKNSLTFENLSKVLSNEKLAREVLNSCEDSMGSEVKEKELKQVSSLALNALRLKEERKKLEEFLQEAMPEIAPEFSKLAAPLIAARLLAKAGSLKRLALMPSSAIQLLGAEKALFRHLKNKKEVKPPKFGILFQHSSVRQAKASEKGKTARKLAGKLSIAVRKDYFRKEKTSQQ